MNDFISEYSILPSTWNQFTIFLFCEFFRKKKILIQVVINRLMFQYVYVRIQDHPFCRLDRRKEFPYQCSQLYLLEQLPLSLCTYPFFLILAF